MTNELEYLESRITRESDDKQAEMQERIDTLIDGIKAAQRLADNAEGIVSQADSQAKAAAAAKAEAQAID
jgi:hypothetical protein